MSFDWRKYLTFAELIYKKANSEDSDCHDKETFYKLRRRFNQPGLSKLEEASLLNPYLLF